MYSNIGGKIKGLAYAVFILETMGALIYGMLLMASDEDLIIAGFLTMLSGPIVAWISTWLLYGFGELIDKAAEIAENTAPKKNAPAAQPAAPAAANAVAEKQARIDALLNLREQGLISEEEYQQALSK